MELQDFLSRNRIDADTWEAADIEWSALVEIFDDHRRRVGQLEDAADFFVKRMQAFEGVHSVRWRVKDPDHLIEKIIRKRAENPKIERYMTISAENYHAVVTDLIGVRALHLFKDDCIAIHDQVVEIWELHEPAVSYVREGDREDLSCELSAREIGPKVHPAGYRSIHYVLKTKPGLREILVEVQVRTVFEEGWSEIDHKVRYPNFTSNPQIENVLKIFNRLAGSADEIGGFIKGLSNEFDLIGERISKADTERDDAISKMQELVSQLTSVTETSEEFAMKANLLQGELDKLKAAIKTGEDTTASDPRPVFITVNGQKIQVSVPKLKRVTFRPPRTPLDV
ncbi:RelA/SpoT domain-containing protein [Pseudomonas syringae]|uniref:RelA/SpoT domain-containing protein n=1 Tax=Pseudomonas syringae TaxID=317 RepID=UPI00177FE7D0|nr:hypothetical protein [Pseudomonas syringae]